MGKFFEGRWRKVYTRMWADEKFASLSAPQPCGQSLWVYLLTGPHTSRIPGVYSISESGIAEKLQWPVSRLRGVFDEILALGMAKFDRRSGLLFIPRAMAYDPPANPNVVRSWAKDWDEVPECDLKRAAYDTLRAFVAERGENFTHAFDAVIERPKPPHGSANSSGNSFDNGSANGLPNRMANQEQEQEQEHKTLKHTSSSQTVSQTVSIAQVREVFEHWQQCMQSPRSKLDDKRTKLIRNALALGYSVDDLKRAIHGCSVSPWHMGENDKNATYNGLDLILRSAEKIDHFIALDASPPKPANGNGHTRDDWFRTDQGVERKARELGLAARAGETYPMLRERVQRAIDDRNRPSAS